MRKPIDPARGAHVPVTCRNRWTNPIEESARGTGGFGSTGSD